MRLTVKIFAIVGIVMGSLAILSCLDSGDGYAFVGGAMFLAWGICDLIYISEN